MIGRKGGINSRRTLSSAESREMVRVREAKRAYRRFHSRCFWHSPADLSIGKRDVPWVAEQLRKHGGMEGWNTATKLCR